MSLITWNDQLKVGVSIIDNDHQQLVRMVNELADAMKAGHGKDVLDKLFHGLVDYTVKHFGNEERLMQQHGYPESPDHKKQHEDLKKQAVDLQQKFKGGSSSVTIETLNFLKNWLANHILGTDKKLAGFLNGQGVK